MFKNTMIALVLSSFAVPAMAEALNGRVAGSSAAGLAADHYSDGIALNPAAPARQSQGKIFTAQISAGLLASDKDKLIEKGQDLSDLIGSRGA